MIHIVGHRNPDSDSICSAIAYSNLKKILGYDVVACRLGPLNEETKYILKKFDVENPLLIDDARSRLSDIEIEAPTVISSEDTLKDAWKFFVHHKVKGLVVKDIDDNYAGYITTSNLSLLRMFEYKEIEELMKTVQINDIAKVVKGNIESNVRDFSFNGVVIIVTLHDMDNYDKNIKNGLCILSDNVEMQKKVIEIGAKCIILSCGKGVNEEVLQLAKEHDCAIITTPKDSMAVTQVIYESIQIKHLMTKDFAKFSSDEFVEDVLKSMTKNKYRSYPVFNKDGSLYGIVTRYNLLNFDKKKFILVDHSSTSQSVPNIKRARIEEIIDHHHIGDIVTDHPIYYRNQICGCTSTIVARLYEENQVVPSKQMAGIMLSAILSDTLHFKSTTTTQLDVDTATALAKLAEVNIDTYAEEMLAASVSLIDSTPPDILYRDLKEYQIEGYNVAIGQTNYSNFENLQKILPEFREYMKTQQETKNYDLLIMMFTKVTSEGSLLVYYGSLKNIVEELIETTIDENSGYDHNMISRKQQVLPKLFDAIKNVM